jgi:hypothetical protein
MNRFSKLYSTLEQVHPGRHTAEDLEFLLSADNAQPLIDRIPLLQIHHKLNMGTMQLFRVHPGPGTILTEVVSANGTKRLNLVRGGGKIGLHLRKIMDELDGFREELGCESIQTVVYSERFLKSLVRSGCGIEGWMLTYSGGGHGK